MTFDELFQRYPWRPIPGCPGRYVLSGHFDLSPLELLGGNAEVREFHSAKARDTIITVQFEGGGLLSYRRSSGDHCHTLNTSEGLERKLAQLGVRNG